MSQARRRVRAPAGELKITPVLTAASEGRGVLDFRQALLDAAPPDFIDNPTILGDLVNPASSPCSWCPSTRRRRAAA